MKKIKLFLSTGLAVFLIRISSVLAQTSERTSVDLTKPVGSGILPGGQVFQADIKTSFFFSRLIPFVIKYTIRLAVAFAVIAIIVGGYQFMTAYGNEEKRTAAKKTITYAIIGLILAITAFGIVKIITTISFTT